MFCLVKRFCFVFAVFLGALTAILVKINRKVEQQVVTRPFQYSNYQKWFEEAKLARHKIPLDSLRYGEKKPYLESQYLHENIPVLCLILVKSEKNFKAIENTWGKHCNKLQKVDLKREKRKIPSIKRSKKDSSWFALCVNLRQVPDNFKWILVVYDYTFVIVENLRLFVAGLDHNEKFYFGHTVQSWGNVYNIGQAGYVLSKGTLDAFKRNFSDDNDCSKIPILRNQEDFYLGKKLASMNITPQDTRDDQGLSTFHSYNLYKLINSELNSIKDKCCSPYTITFQGIEGDKMYTYYYLIYTVQLFNSGHLGNRLPVNNFTDDHVWKSFLRDRGLPVNITAQEYYKIWEGIVDDPTSFAKHMKYDD